MGARPGDLVDQRRASILGSGHYGVLQIEWRMSSSIGDPRVDSRSHALNLNAKTNSSESGSRYTIFALNVSTGNPGKSDSKVV